MLLKVQYISVIVQLITELFDNLEIFLVLLTDWPEPDSDVILDAWDDNFRSATFCCSRTVDCEVIVLAAQSAHQTLESKKENVTMTFYVQLVFFIMLLKFKIPKYSLPKISEFALCVGEGGY